jgi:type IV secretion system protein VirD4
MEGGGFVISAIGFALKIIWKIVYLPIYLLYLLGKRFYRFMIKGAGTKAQDGEKPPLTMLTATPKGFIFGKDIYQGHYLHKPESTDGHILVVGGAGSGKTSCLAIPSLIAWQKRIFAIDIKGELYRKTGSARTNSKVFKPTDTNSYGYDPFYIISEDNLSQEAREIALALIPMPVEIREPFWIEGAQNILTGAIIHFYSQGCSFIDTMIKIQETAMTGLLNDICKNPLARRHINQYMELEDKTLSSIIAELGRHITIFATDKNIQQVFTKKEIITPQDLENGFDIFISIPEYKLRQWKNIMSLIVSQFLNHFERRSDSKVTPILFLLDEFPRLGKMQIINDALATLRSRKITICLIIQSLAQLDAIYGKEFRQVIADNCSYKAILQATDADTQQYFSRIVGTYEKKTESRSENYAPLTGFERGKTVSEHIEEKYIIKPEEFATLTDIVLLTPHGFIRAEKLFYYKHEIFSVPEITITPPPRPSTITKNQSTAKSNPQSKQKYAPQGYDAQSEVKANPSSASTTVENGVKTDKTYTPPVKPNTSRESQAKPKIDKEPLSATTTPRTSSHTETINSNPTRDNATTTKKNNMEFDFESFISELLSQSRKLYDGINEVTEKKVLVELLNATDVLYLDWQKATLKAQRDSLNVKNPFLYDRLERCSSTLMILRKAINAKKVELATNTESEAKSKINRKNNVKFDINDFMSELMDSGRKIHEGISEATSEKALVQLTNEIIRLEMKWKRACVENRDILDPISYDSLESQSSGFLFLRKAIEVKKAEVTASATTPQTPPQQPKETREKENISLFADFNSYLSEQECKLYQEINNVFDVIGITNLEEKISKLKTEWEKFCIDNEDTGKMHPTEYVNIKTQSSNFTLIENHLNMKKAEINRKYNGKAKDIKSKPEPDDKVKDKQFEPKINKGQQSSTPTSEKKEDEISRDKQPPKPKKEQKFDDSLLEFIDDELGDLFTKYSKPGKKEKYKCEAEKIKIEKPHQETKTAKRTTPEEEFIKDSEIFVLPAQSPKPKESKNVSDWIKWVTEYLVDIDLTVNEATTQHELLCLQATLRDLQGDILHWGSVKGYGDEITKWNNIEAIFMKIDEITIPEKAASIGVEILSPCYISEAKKQILV